MPETSPRRGDDRKYRLTDPQGPEVVDRVTTDLQLRFEGVFAPDIIRRAVEESYAQINTTSHVDEFVATLTARSARERLVAIAKYQGVTVTHKPEVMFVCVRDAGRSQMAAALLRRHGHNRIVVRSAGTEPADTLDPIVVTAMAELDINLTEESPKKLTSEAVAASDVIVTMDTRDECPIFAGKRYLDWDFDDPCGKPIEEVRRIRDGIDDRVRGLVVDLLAAN